MHCPLLCETCLSITIPIVEQECLFPQTQTPLYKFMLFRISEIWYYFICVLHTFNFSGTYLLIIIIHFYSEFLLIVVNYSNYKHVLVPRNCNNLPNNMFTFEFYNVYLVFLFLDKYFLHFSQSIMRSDIHLKFLLDFNDVIVLQLTLSYLKVSSLKPYFSHVCNGTFVIQQVLIYLAGSYIQQRPIEGFLSTLSWVQCLGYFCESQSVLPQKLNHFNIQ